MPKTPSEIQDFIKKEEGFKLTSYKCPAGVWTIGWGHTTDPYFAVRPGQTITKEKAEDLFQHDLQEAESAVVTRVKVPLNKWQLGALVSLVFNIGETRFAGSTLLRRLNTGDYKAVPRQLILWNKGRLDGDGPLVTMPGLVTRRAREIEWWNKGVTNVEPQPEDNPSRGGVEKDPGKPASHSTTILTAIVGIITTILTPFLEAIKQVKDTIGDNGLTIVLALMVVGCFVYIIRERMRRAREDSV